jgi:hypothetical protein
VDFTLRNYCCIQRIPLEIPEKTPLAVAVRDKSHFYEAITPSLAIRDSKSEVPVTNVTTPSGDPFYDKLSHPRLHGSCCLITFFFAAQESFDMSHLVVRRLARALL